MLDLQGEVNQMTIKQPQSILKVLIEMQRKPRTHCEIRKGGLSRYKSHHKKGEVQKIENVVVAEIKRLIGDQDQPLKIRKIIRKVQLISMDHKTGVAEKKLRGAGVNLSLDRSRNTNKLSPNSLSYSRLAVEV